MSVETQRESVPSNFAEAKHLAELTLTEYRRGESAERILSIFGGEFSSVLLEDPELRALALDRSRQLLAWNDAKEALDIANLFDFSQEELRDPDLHLNELGTEYLQRNSGHDEVADALHERFGQAA